LPFTPRSVQHFSVYLGPRISKINMVQATKKRKIRPKLQQYDVIALTLRSGIQYRFDIDFFVGTYQMFLLPTRVRLKYNRFLYTFSELFPLKSHND
jgi:hypothetical protein